MVRATPVLATPARPVGVGLLLLLSVPPISSLSAVADLGQKGAYLRDIAVIPKPDFHAPNPNQRRKRDLPGGNVTVQGGKTNP